ncbi:MAG: hypothetical protein MHPSP_002687 [Paramarteilia canceri]
MPIDPDEGFIMTNLISAIEEANFLKFVGSYFDKMNQNFKKDPNYILQSEELDEFQINKYCLKLILGVEPNFCLDFISFFKDFIDSVSILEQFAQFNKVRTRIVSAKLLQFVEQLLTMIPPSEMDDNQTLAFESIIIKSLQIIRFSSKVQNFSKIIDKQQCNNIF